MCADLPGKQEHSISRLHRGYRETQSPHRTSKVHVNGLMLRELPRANSWVTLCVQTWPLCTYPCWCYLPITYRILVAVLWPPLLMSCFGPTGCERMGKAALAVVFLNHTAEDRSHTVLTFKTTASESLEAWLPALFYMAHVTPAVFWGATRELRADCLGQACLTQHQN